MAKFFNLPTLERLNASVPDDLNVHAISAKWMAAFAACAEAGDAPAIADLFIAESHWRDMLALTWDFRSFHGIHDILAFLTDRLVWAHPTAFRIVAAYTKLDRPYPDLAWVQMLFAFETDLGHASGIVRLVPQPTGATVPWKAHCMYTNLEGLKRFPELIGSLRSDAPNHGRWAQERASSMAFEGENPTVLIIGGGHSGLGIAARLKDLGMRALVIERHVRLGDNWRGRYEALCLHDPVWYDHMPHMPFPPTWPVYTPALKLANWLESYAEALELDVWTSSTAISARKDRNGTWEVLVERAGTHRLFKVKHLVFATGMGEGQSSIPDFPGLDNFKGEILHSTKHKRALDYVGKKVVVLGAATSAHDIAVDFCRHGIDVTIYQRSSTYVMSTENGWKHMMRGTYWEGAPPTDISDRVNASFPHLMNIELGQRLTRKIAEDDEELLDGLRRCGFKLNMGIMDAGFGFTAWNRAGGFYLDVGGSQLLIDGKIKLKNDSQISGFTESGIRFDDGSKLEADALVFATGLGDPRDAVRAICGDDIGDKCGQIWGLDEEGEIRGAWRDLGVPNLWYMIGNLALCRFHSKHVALQIKAMEEGLFDGRYSA
ncbi:hypothetical protein DFH09DRAFT_906286 [Mycena vulgaris]|nr:hypothetical protein DFH09DRAFT_906286 [Mycena vulgaris]